MSWLEKLLPAKIQQTTPSERHQQIPEGLWIKCPSCEAVLYKTDLDKTQNVCPTCGHHHRIGARARLNHFLDAEGRYEIGQEVIPVDALKFQDSRKYPQRLKEALENTGETDALVVMGGAVKGIDLVAACLNSTSWAAPWAPWWASALCAVWKPPSSKRCRSCALPPPVVRACKKACCP